MSNHPVAFAQLTKIDVEKRLVYGRAAQETPDHAGEVMDYEQSKPNFQKWSDEMSKATNGASQGNLRSMHGNTAAGKIQELIYNDDEHAIDVVAKVVDDNEWEKCLEGVYTGFSIGGKYGARVTKGEFKHYEAIPSEISLVDRPCIPTATFFDIQKADGSVMQKAFQGVSTMTKAQPIEYTVDGTPEDADALAKLLHENKLSIGDALAVVEKMLITAAEDALEKAAPFADVVNGKYPVDNPAQVKAAWNYIHKNAANYTADALQIVKANIIAAWADKIGGDMPLFEVAKADAATDLKKDLYSVGQLGQMLQSLYYLTRSAAAEAGREQDGSDVPARLADVAKTVAQIYKDMAIEEADELVEEFGESDTQPEIMQMAAGLVTSLAKAGARNSAADQDTLQKLHDLSTKLGAACAKTEKAEPAGELTKSDKIEELAKGGPGSGPNPSGATKEVQHVPATHESVPMDRATYTHATKEQAVAHANKLRSSLEAAGHKKIDENSPKSQDITGRHTTTHTSKDDSKEVQISTAGNTVVMRTTHWDKGYKKSEQLEDLAKLDQDHLQEHKNTDELNKLISAAVDPLNKALQEATEKIAKLEAMPAPAKGVLRVVDKSGDVVEAVAKVEIPPVVERDGKINDVASALKKIHASGGAPLLFGAPKTN